MWALPNNKVNPHYRRLTQTYRDYFDPLKLRIGWLIWLVVVIASLMNQAYRANYLIPLVLVGIIIIIGIETARFVATDQQKPIYEMTLLTPIGADEIVAGYRQAIFARTARWFGIPFIYLIALFSLSYIALSYQMYGLIEENMFRTFQTSAGTIDPFFDEQFIHQLVLIEFTMWLSLLFSTFTYYLLIVEIYIELGLRFENWLIALGVGLITIILVWLSSLVVVGIISFFASLFAFIHDFIPIIFISVCFCMYPLYWKNVFKERAIKNIRVDEKKDINTYVDLA